MNTIENKKAKKWDYSKVIQQNCCYGWEDVSTYETNSQFLNFQKSGVFKENSKGKNFEVSLINHDFAEYARMGYAVRIIKRKTLNKGE